jgi:acetyl esterase
MMQLLVYPACDLVRQHVQSADAIAVLTPAHLSWLRDRIATVSDLDDPDVSPLRHEATADLPMTILLTAGFDPLRDEALEYAHKLAEAGVPVQVLHYPGQFHGFISFDRVLAGGSDALDRLGLALRRGFESRTLKAGTECISISALHSLRKVMLGLHPIQRLRETAVACLVLREALERRFEGRS